MDCRASTSLRCARAVSSTDASVAATCSARRTIIIITGSCTISAWLSPLTAASIARDQLRIGGNGRKSRAPGGWRAPGIGLHVDAQAITAR